MGNSQAKPLQRRYVAPQAQAQLSGALDIPNRRATFVASSGAVDSFGTSIVASGLRLDRLLANGVFLWQHKRTDPDDSIGRIISARVEGDRLVVVAEFSTTTDLARRCWQAVVDGRVSAISIGFDTLSSHVEGDVVVIDQAEVFECSLCLIGSNPDALAVRAFIEGNRTMNDVLKTLGLAEGATPDEIVKALVMYLAKTDEDKALAAEALKGLGDSAERAAEPMPSASSASDGAAAADEAREEEMLSSVRKLAERVAQLEARSKPEHIAAAVRAEMSKAKPATVATPAKRGSSLGLRMFAGGNPAKPVGAAPAIGPQTGSAAKGIMARVDAQLNGRSE